MRAHRDRPLPPGWDAGFERPAPKRFDWRTVLRHAWSIRLIALAAGVQLAAECVPYVSDYVPWWVSVGLTVAAFGARLIPQKELSGGDA